MRVTDIELSYGEVNFLDIGVQNVSSDARFLVKAMVGLDADEIVNKFYGFSKTSGKRQYNFSLPKREVVFRIVLNPSYQNNETISDIRDRLYRTIAADRSGIITILFRAAGASIATLEGFVTKFEVPHFSEEPELQITIKCDDPLLRAVGPVINDSDDLPSTENFVLTDTVSTAPHGFEMLLNCDISSPDFVLRDQEVNPEFEFSVVPGTAFAIGDQLRVSSIYGDKVVELLPAGGGDPVPLLDRVVVGSFWPLIFPGSNYFWIENLGTSWSWDKVTYYPTFWGV